MSAPLRALETIGAKRTAALLAAALAPDATGATLSKPDERFSRRAAGPGALHHAASRACMMQRL